MMQTQLLIVGAGSIGERHLRCFQNTERCQVSFVELREDLRQSIADRYQVPAYPTLESALASSNRFTAAVIATPADLHIEIAVRLAQAGLHLLIEKPLSTTLDKIDELQRIVRAGQLKCGIAYVYRCYPALASMRQALLSGQFGKPLSLVANCGQSFPTYRPAYRQTYYARHSTGGGAIQDALTHVLNAAEWLVGPIDRLVADADHQMLDGVEVEDTVNVVTRHASVMGCFSLNQHQAPNETTITLVCEKGTLRFETHASRWRWLTMPDQPWQDQPSEPLSRDGPFMIQAHHFLDAIDGRVDTLCSLDEGLQTLRVNLATLASVRTKSWQTIASWR